MSLTTKNYIALSVWISSAAFGSGVVAQESPEVDFSIEGSIDGLVTKEQGESESELSIDVYPTVTLTIPSATWSAEIEFAPEFYIVSNDDGTEIDDPYAYLDIAVSHKNGFRIEASIESTYDLDAEDWVDTEWSISASSDKIGKLTYGYVDSAMGDGCVEAPGSTNNFGHDDLTSFGTCESHGYAGTLLYTSPSFGGGYTFRSSFSSPSEGDRSAGDLKRSVSAAVGYEGSWGSQDVEWSVGVEHVSQFEGIPDFGGDALTAAQAGILLQSGKWAYGASLGITKYAGTSVKQRAISVGAEYQASEHVLVAGGATIAELADFETTPFANDREVSYGLAIEYAAIPDTLIFDAGVSFAEGTFGADDKTQFGVGFTRSF